MNKRLWQRLIIIIIGVVLALAGCDSGKPVRQITNLGDTPYQQDTILVTYATNPERALTLLDSALLLGNISDESGEPFDELLIEQKKNSLWVHFAVRPEGHRRKVMFIT